MQTGSGSYELYKAEVEARKLLEQEITSLRATSSRANTDSQTYYEQYKTEVNLRLKVEVELQNAKRQLSS